MTIMGSLGSGTIIFMNADEYSLNKSCLFWLSAAHYYDGVVDLCLSAAFKRDPQNLALIYYKNGKKPEDAHGMEAFSAR